jgi:AraC-like DNA-binding protein
MSTVFDTNDFPAAQRFVQWRDCASNLFLPVDVASRDHDAFRFRSIRRTVGDVVFSTAFARDVQVTRAEYHIADPDECPLTVIVPTSGTMGIADTGRERLTRAGELTFVNSARPYHFEVVEDFSYLAIHVPRERIQCRLGQRESLGGLSLGQKNPGARLAIEFIRNIASVADQLSAEGGPLVVEQMLDLVALAAAQSLGEEPLDAEVRRVATLYSAKVFIDRNLPDRNLSLDTVAAALKISQPHLNELLGESESSHWSYIHEQRLAKCARDLVTPDLADRSVADIARSWGIFDLAMFRRSFKVQYGETPDDYRATRSR